MMKDSGSIRKVKMKYGNKLLLFGSGFMVFYWILQFLMLSLFGVGYCSEKSFFGCVLPILYIFPLIITLIIFVPIWKIKLNPKKT